MALFLKIRRAETALHDGRLDEAYELVGSEAIREHRRGQKLLTKLAGDLLDRARKHLDAQRPREALDDCGKAAQLAGNSPDIAEVKSRAASMIDHRAADARQQHHALSAAQRHIQAGRLSLAENIINDLQGGNGEAKAVRDQLEQKRTAIQRAIGKAEIAADTDEPLDAVQHLSEARRLGADDSQVARLTRRVAGSAAERLADAVNTGRIDHARSLVHLAAPLAHASTELADLVSLLEQIELAHSQLSAGHADEAATLLHRLASLHPKAMWLAKTAEAAEQASDALEQVRRGPLGLIPPEGIEQTIAHKPAANRGMGGVAAGSVQPRGDLDVVRQPLGGRMPADPNAKSLLHMQVDGVGGFLITPSSSVTIGPISSSRKSDIALIADPTLTRITIRREDEDYFLEAEHTVAVNHKPVTRTLLADGAKIDLSPRCRIRFRRPNPASTTAMIDLGHGARLPIDARSVILLDRELIIGPGRAAHISNDDLAEPIVLALKNNRLVCTTKQGVLAEGQPIAAHDGLPTDTPLRVGPAALVIRQHHV